MACDAATQHLRCFASAVFAGVTGSRCDLDAGASWQSTEVAVGVQLCWGPRRERSSSCLR